MSYEKISDSLYANAISDDQVLGCGWMGMDPYGWGLFQVTVDAADIVLVRSDLRDLLVSCQRHPMTAVLPDGLSGSHSKLHTLSGNCILGAKGSPCHGCGGGGGGWPLASTLVTPVYLFHCFQAFFALAKETLRTIWFNFLWLGRAAIA